MEAERSGAPGAGGADAGPSGTVPGGSPGEGGPDLTDEQTGNPTAESAGTQDSTVGPFDRGGRCLAPHHLDLGALWLVGVPGMQLRLEADQESGEVTAASLLDGDSAMQIQAFAAPKSAGLWAEIQEEIAQGVQGQGGTTEGVPGPWGSELLGRLPGRGPGGQRVFNPARFIGVDGPRWFLRAVITGPATADEALAEPFLEVLRGCVVTRGSEAMAPRQVLPLRLPDQEEPLPEAEPDEDFTPFERGPEITEIH